MDALSADCAQSPGSVLHDWSHMSDKLPYVPAYGVITKVLDKVKSAATPERFTQDFLSTKLGFKGGSAKPVIPFFKRTGLLGSDGSPTELYRRFRNPTETAKAIAQAVRIGYRTLYEMNEYVHDLPDKDLKGLIVQATGLAPDSNTVKIVLGSFKALRAFASFDGESETTDESEEVSGPEEKPSSDSPPHDDHLKTSLKLGLAYTINLNLPSTSDVAVFNAIFKSLREHLLR